MSAVSDAELEEELSDLLRESGMDVTAKNPVSSFTFLAFKMPDVPSSTVAMSTPRSKFASDEDNIARLKRLLETDQ
uniref:Uncharacterized protein n=1 Tax=Romanomermis culicivorax TaxID=13658 RepID=A0A915JHP3_ROMCU